MSEASNHGEKDEQYLEFILTMGPPRLGRALKATAIAVRTQNGYLEAPVTLMRTNQPDGFDCPGCAWPDKEHRSTFQFCETAPKP
ncbi:hypothetical protein M8494_10225 [Serratia ureilytica]